MFSLPIDDELELRSHDEAHAEALFALVDTNREHLRPWLPWVDGTRSPDDTRDFIRGTQSAATEGRALGGALWYRGQIVGTAGFVELNLDVGRGEIGYWLDAEHTGRGFVTRTCRALIDHGFSQLDLHRVQLCTTPRNAASRAVAERLGFTLEGTLRSYSVLNEQRIDICVYGLLREEWEA